MLCLSNKRWLSIATKVVRYTKYGVCIFTLVTAIWFCRRFGVMKIPPGYETLPAGCYILVDWDFTSARHLRDGDKVLYRTVEDTQRLSLGTIVFTFPTSIPIQYMIQPEIVKNKDKMKAQEENVVCAIDQIRGRMVMVLLQPD